MQLLIFNQKKKKFSQLTLMDKNKLPKFCYVINILYKN